MVCHSFPPELLKKVDGTSILCVSVCVHVCVYTYVVQQQQQVT